MADTSILQQSLWLISACELGLINTSRARQVLLEIKERPHLNALEWMVRAGDISRDQAEALIRQSTDAASAGVTTSEDPSTTDGEPHSAETQSWNHAHQSFDPHAIDIALEIGNRSAHNRRESRFRIIRPLAAGGLGIVSVAEDQQFQRHVALKQMQSRLAHDEGMQRKFLFEAEVTGRLEHPSIVPIYALGVDANSNPYYAMRLVQGRDLRAHIREFHEQIQAGKRELNGPELRQLLRRFLDICNAMSYAHERGILHRDLKPGNVMLGEFGETFVVDWGLAKSLGQRSNRQHTQQNEAVEIPELETAFGQFLGTPAYAPPEQLRGLLDRLDQRSDIYSLGAILFEILVGQPPVQSKESPYTLAAQLERTGPPCANAISSAVPRSLSAIAEKAMQASQELRYPDAIGLRKDIEAWLDDSPVSSYRENSIEKLARYFRKYRVASLITGVALVLITITALVGLFSYRQIATVARSNESAALLADKTSREMLRTASRLEFETANNLIRTSYTSEDETLRASHPGYKSHWHLGAARLIQAIKLDPENGDAKIRLYSTLVHQGLARRDFPSASLDFKTRVEPQVSEDGSVLAFLKDDSTICLCELNQGLSMTSFVPLNTAVFSFCLSADGKLLAAETAEKLVLINTSTLRQVASLAAANELPLLFDESSRFVGVANRETLKLSRWRPAEDRLEELPVLKPLKSRIVLRSAKASSLLTHQFDYLFQWTNIATAQQFMTAPTRTVGSIGQPFAFHGSKPQLMLGTELGAVLVLEPGSGTQLTSRAATRKEFACTAVAISPDGGRTAVGFNNGQAEILDAHNASVLLELPRNHYTVSLLRFSPDGILLAVAAGNLVRVWNTLTGQAVTEPLPHPGTIRDLAISRDSTRVYVWTDQGKVYESHVNDGGPTQLNLKQPGVSLQYEFTPDEKFIASTAYESYQQFAYNRLDHIDWSLEDLQPTSNQPIKNFNAYPESLLSPTGRLAMTYDMAGNVQIWEVLTGELLKHLPAAKLFGDLQGRNAQQIKRVFWSSDETLIGCVVGRVWYQDSNDAEACQLWNWREGKRIWDSNDALGGPGLVSVQNDYLACSRQIGRQFSAVACAIDNPEQVSPAVVVQDLDKVVEQQLLSKSQQLVVVTRQESTDGSVANGPTLHKLSLRTGKPEEKALVFPVDSQVRFLRDHRNGAGQLLVVAGVKLVDVEKWTSIPLDVTAPTQLENLMLIAQSNLLVASANSELRSRFWDVNTGKRLFEANYNGVAAASPLGTLMTISHPLNTMTSLLDMAARYEIEEPIQTGVPQTVKLSALAKFSSTGKLLALQAVHGLMVRDLLSPEDRLSIATIEPSEMGWIESWIGLRVNGQGVYEVLSAEERLSAVTAAKPTTEAWVRLQSWLSEDVAVRTLTPYSTILARDANFACGRPETLSESCDAYDHCSDDSLIRMKIASALMQPAAPPEWQLLLNTHLVRHTGSSIDLRDPATCCRTMRLLLPALRTTASNQTSKEVAQSLFLNASSNLERLMDSELGLWSFHESALEFQQIVKLCSESSLYPEPVLQAVERLITLFWQQSENQPNNLPTRIEATRAGLRHEVAISELAPIARAIESKDFATATKQIEVLQSKPVLASLTQQARELLESYQQPVEANIVPAEWPGESTELFLDRAKADSQVTQAHIKADGNIAVMRLDDLPLPHALQAPDPTAWTYRLGQKWSQFRGKVGLQTKARTQQLIFEIYGDGKLLWTSHIMFSGRSQAFDVDVATVNELKLITRGVPNVNWQNPAVWSNPVLSRGGK